MKRALALIAAVILFTVVGGLMTATHTWLLRILILAIAAPGFIWLYRVGALRKGSEAEQAKGGDRRFTALFALRVIGILVLGLLVAMAFRDLFQGLDTNFASNLTAIIGLSAFILVVGPFWPSQENLDKWAQNSKFNLPTDSPAVALYVLNFCTSLLSLYMAWRRYAHLPTDLWRHEKVVLMISGQAGLVVSWLIVAIGCFTAGVVTYKKAKQKKKPDLPI